MSEHPVAARGASKIGANYRKLVAASAVSNIGDGVAQIAYPWLASAVTRNPLLIAVIGIAQRLPWLVFTLPVGVLTDRKDRRVLMAGANTLRAVLTVFVAIAVVGFGGDLPGPDQLNSVVDTDVALYLALIVSSILLGIGEVVHDNAAQTFMPSIVAEEHLEHANGRLYTVETVANQFVGPPFGSLLLAIGFAVPFFVDAGTFAVAAVLVAWIAPPAARAIARNGGADAPGEPAAAVRARWQDELREGVRWLWEHRLLRSLAITLGLLNLLSNVTTASWVLYAQEVLGTDSTEFALITVIASVGALVGGWLSGRLAKRFGSGTLLRWALITFTAVTFVIGVVSWWPIAAALLAVEFFTTVQWNVITVSLRQTIIPDRLLGRVNSVYRFFAWGMIPIGTALGGLIVVVTERFTSRETALRVPWWIAGGGYVVLLATYALPRLTTANIERARAGTSDPDEAPVPSADAGSGR